MNLAPARTAAFGALLAVDRGSWSAEALAIKSERLDSRDAGLASDIVFGVLRRKGQLDAFTQHYTDREPATFDPGVRTALQMAFYQLRFLDRVPPHAIVNDAVELTRRSGKPQAAAMVNAVLRRALREPWNARESLATPYWISARWTARYGAPVSQAIAHASLNVPERFIRVGSDMPPEGAEPTEIPGCYRLPTGSNEGFRFQDIGSQTVVRLLGLASGQSFLDLCAAPGNKTAQAMEAGVRAVACELHLSRAQILKPLGIPVVVADATLPLPLANRFDRILADVPCSGTGTLARNPEIKWRLTPADIPDLARRQTAILRNGLALLAPGGRLVYSTCSMEREENEDVIRACGARILETMTRIPGQDSGDGFFAAVLRL